ncbi:DDE-type integrase/transposase/recombinase [Desulfobulbus sp. AH-315-M07]|nr:DDE-type integrase/transposase/recombinase [Desulfobulbus sp. AH-315-M07]
MHSKFKPKNHREAVAIFRSEIVGALVRQDLDHGQRAAELRRLSKQRFRPPSSPTTRRYSVPTLERWYYAYRRGGLEALEPKRRGDGGRARALTDEQRKLLLDIRREHRSASVPLILRTLHLDGRLDKAAVSAQTVRRLYLDHGLDRIPLRDGSSPKMRLRWQADRPGALWHADVMHGKSFVQDGKRKTVRVHALLDDASRYIVALEALHTEREEDMLRIFVRALRTHGCPEALFLDNGSTYRGEILRIACARLGITLVHARPYDPEARGKMERYWRTLRQGCADYIVEPESLHDINVRLWAYVGQHYHQAPHAGLLGRSPDSVWAEAAEERRTDDLDEDKLRQALTVRERRRVRRDTTVSVAGATYELDQGFLAGRVVTIGYCVLDESLEPWVELDGKRLGLHLVDPERNARRERPPRRPGQEPPATQGGAAVSFQPADALLDRAVGRKPRTGVEDER